MGQFSVGHVVAIAMLVLGGMLFATTSQTPSIMFRSNRGLVLSQQSVSCPTTRRFRGDNELNPVTGRRYPNVLLYSFEGSGNSWTRMMFENITGEPVHHRVGALSTWRSVGDDCTKEWFWRPCGAPMPQRRTNLFMLLELNRISRICAGIYSGCIYYDPVMALNGFPGETHTTNVVFVKAHYKRHPVAVNGTLGHYDKVIHLVRNPFNAMVAERKRLIADTMTFWNIHQFTPPLAVFLKGGKYNGTDAYQSTSIYPWKQWVKGVGIVKWLNTLNAAKQWANATSVPIFTMKYEDMKRDTHGVVERALAFMGALPP